MISDVRDVINVVTRMRCSWKIFATMLLGESCNTEMIEADHSKSCDCIHEVVCTWKRLQQPLFTWGALVEVLRQPAILENELASEIEQKYLTSN